MHSLRPLLASTDESAAAPRSQSLLVVLTAMLALIIAMVASAFPIPLMPGVFGTLALVAAVIIAGVAWWLSVERSSDRLTLWNVAEGFASIGVVALLIGRSDQALQLLGVPG